MIGHDIHLFKALLLALGIMSTEPKDSAITDWTKGREELDFCQIDMDSMFTIFNLLENFHLVFTASGKEKPVIKPPGSHTLLIPPLKITYSYGNLPWKLA